ncbi:AAA family ATPase [Nocardia seriolae]|nr:AAA family ATPase [Nocardia seriolae]
MLQKIIIQNYKIFQDFTLEFNPDVNIIVGDNEAGKSTLLEAVNLALTGRLLGKSLQGELSPHLFNQNASKQYLTKLSAGENPTPPEIVIDLFLASSVETARLKGTNNAFKEDVPGVRLRMAFNEEFAAEYLLFTEEGNASSIPVEYYSVEWVDFSGSAITQRSVPIFASVINAARIRLQSGADYYLQKIISGTLSDNQRVQLMRAYRDMKVAFSDDASISEINKALNLAKGEVSDKSLSLSVDHSPQAGWESGLVPHLDELPFTFVGAGEQSMLKILLAINRKIEESHVILVEEPENHLSFSSLNKLVTRLSHFSALVAVTRRVRAVRWRGPRLRRNGVSRRGVRELGWSIGGANNSPPLKTECSADAPAVHLTGRAHTCPVPAAEVFHRTDFHYLHHAGGGPVRPARDPHRVRDAHRRRPGTGVAPHPCAPVLLRRSLGSGPARPGCRGIDCGPTSSAGIRDHGRGR